MTRLYFFVHRSVFTVSVTTICLLARSQDVTYAWARGLTGTGDAFAAGLAVDKTGNVYTAGFFEGTMDFDPGAGTATLTSTGGRDAFIGKLNASGNYVWAKQVGGTADDEAGRITVDASGNVYVTGYTWNGANAFITKLNSVGNYVWTTLFNGNFIRGNAIALDAAGNVYTTGLFTGSADFSPGTGTAIVTSAGGNDIFISKHDANGNFLWVRTFGSTLDDAGAAVAADAGGNVYTTGFFRATVDFDPGAGIADLTAAGDADVFISKFNANGNYIWAKQSGGTATDYGNDIITDAAGNVHVTGSFSGTADFDPGAGTANLTSDSVDIYVSKLDASGNYSWAKQIGGPSFDWAQSIALDTGGNVYTTGFFHGTIDVDPGAGIALLAAAGDADVFISKLNTSGNYIYAKQLGGSSTDAGAGIVTDTAGNVYSMGVFNGTADMDPGPATASITATGTQGVFVSKLVSLITGPLPLTWLNVEGRLNTQQQAVINWAVQEINVKEYTIEKSIDGLAFSRIGTQAGKGDGEHNYTFTEPAVLQNSAWYRVKQTDIDGHSTYSVIIQLSSMGKSPAIVFPVPVREAFTIQINGSSLLHTKATLVDISGRPVKIIAINDYSTVVNATDLPRGIYVLQLTDGSSIKITRQ